MSIIQCPNHHYYDDKRNSTCPYCEKISSASAKHDEVGEWVTSYVLSLPQDNAQLTESYGETVCEFEKTINFCDDETQNIFTAGWLVCIEGNEKGKSHVICSGRNYVGRSQYMDIVLSDNSVSEEKHFSIVYDPKSVTFYIICGTGHTYLNGKAVLSESVIADGDMIQVGTSKYVFVAYCKKGREWN